jgi:hypothetical protein
MDIRAAELTADHLGRTVKLVRVRFNAIDLVELL